MASDTSNYQILVDSDAFVGWLLPRDAHHERVGSIFETIFRERRHLVTTSWVLMETATVLSKRDGQALARQFLDQMEALEFPVIHMTEALQRASSEVFRQQEQRGTSMIDCGNVVIMQTFRIPQILSFDKVYFKVWNFRQAA